MNQSETINNNKFNFDKVLKRLTLEPRTSSTLDKEAIIKHICFLMRAWLKLRSFEGCKQAIQVDEACTSKRNR